MFTDFEKRFTNFKKVHRKRNKVQKFAKKFIELKKYHQKFEKKSS